MKSRQKHEIESDCDIFEAQQVFHSPSVWADKWVGARVSGWAMYVCDNKLSSFKCKPSGNVWFPITMFCARNLRFVCERALQRLIDTLSPNSPLWDQHCAMTTPPTFCNTTQTQTQKHKLKLLVIFAQTASQLSILRIQQWPTIQCYAFIGTPKGNIQEPIAQNHPSNTTKKIVRPIKRRMVRIFLLVRKYGEHRTQHNPSVRVYAHVSFWSKFSDF